jgi:hypothetical protein
MRKCKLDDAEVWECNKDKGIHSIAGTVNFLWNWESSISDRILCA